MLFSIVLSGPLPLPTPAGLYNATRTCLTLPPAAASPAAMAVALEAHLGAPPPLLPPSAAAAAAEAFALADLDPAAEAQLLEACRVVLDREGNVVTDIPALLAAAVGRMVEAAAVEDAVAPRRREPTRLHGCRPPGISLEAYAARLLKYCKCSPVCFLSGESSCRGGRGDGGVWGGGESAYGPLPPTGPVNRWRLPQPVARCCHHRRLQLSLTMRVTPCSPIPCPCSAAFAYMLRLHAGVGGVQGGRVRVDALTAHRLMAVGLVLATKFNDDK